jgi:integrase
MLALWKSSAATRVIGLLLVWTQQGASFGQRHWQPILHSYALLSLSVPGMSMPAMEDQGTQIVPQGYGKLSSRIQAFLLTTLKERTQTIYVEALGNLKTDLDELGLSWNSLSCEDRDCALAEIIMTRIQNGDSPFPTVNLLAALKKIQPGLKLPCANQLVITWKASLPVKQAPACPRNLAFALATLAAACGQHAVAIAILLCFTGLLRIGEALGLTCKCVVLSHDALILMLGRTKRGLEERVVINHDIVISWLRAFLKARSLKPDDSLLSLSYGKFSYWLNKLTRLLHCEHLKLSSHSFRRGGASTLFNEGMGLMDVAAHGRWASESSCREYIRRGELYILRYSVETSNTQAAVDFLLKFFNDGKKFFN